MKGLDLNELLDALEAGRSLLVWIASWHASSGDEAVQEAWAAERSALAMRRLLGLVAEDDILESSPARLTPDAIRALQPEAPSLARLVRLSRKVLQLQTQTLALSDFVRWGWWTAITERVPGQDPIRWVWSNSADPHKLAQLLQWVGWEESYGAAVGLTVRETSAVAPEEYERWCQRVCAAVRDLAETGPCLDDLPTAPGDADDAAAFQLAQFLRRLVAGG